MWQGEEKKILSSRKNMCFASESWTSVRIFDCFCRSFAGRGKLAPCAKSGKENLDVAFFSPSLSLYALVLHSAVIQELLGQKAKKQKKKKKVGKKAGWWKCNRGAIFPKLVECLDWFFLPDTLPCLVATNQTFLRHNFPYVVRDHSLHILGIFCCVQNQKWQQNLACRFMT